MSMPFLAFLGVLKGAFYTPLNAISCTIPLYMFLESRPCNIRDDKYVLLLFCLTILPLANFYIASSYWCVCLTRCIDLVCDILCSFLYVDLRCKLSLSTPLRRIYRLRSVVCYASINILIIPSFLHAYQFQSLL